MDLVVALHSHLPYVLNHGRWPHGSDWICEAAVDTYLPLLEMLGAVEVEGAATPITLGITPILASQLASPTFARELRSFFAQRLTACDAAIGDFEASGETKLTPIAEFWRGRLARLERLFDRLDGDMIAAFRSHAEHGRIELISSAATHGFLPLLATDESIRFQLAAGLAEHRRLFGARAAGCWAPECAYRPRGPWAPHPAAPASPLRRGIEEHLGDAGYRYFFTDSHLAQAGKTLGLYREPDFPDGALLPSDDALDLPVARSPYRAYLVAPRARGAGVSTLVRDPISSRRVWSRYQGYPGDGGYLEFHKIRFPGGLKFWKVTGSDADLGDKLRYDPNAARAIARRHGRDYARLMNEIVRHEAAEGSLIAVPFDTELFGHWWFEGVDFLGDFYRELGRTGGPTPTTASAHLDRRPPTAAATLAEGSWGANGDFSKWLNPLTEWTWERLWPAEARFWTACRQSIDRAPDHRILAQAGRELLLAQSSDWQFIISSETAGDYATKRFNEHLDNLDRLTGALETGERDPALETALSTFETTNAVFPEIIPALRTALALTGPIDS